MAKYNVPCSWSMYGDIQVEADSIGQAIDRAEDEPLPSGEYMGDSFEIIPGEVTKIG